EQSGAPLDIYDRPATRFVAGFLGSPAMNFLEARVAAGGDARAAGTGLALEVGAGASLPLEPGAFAGEVAKGSKVTVGVRPHDLELVASPDTPALAARVVLCEALGGETYAHATVGEQPLVVRLGGSERLDPGASLRLRAPRIHLFDPASGRALARAT
ncbi:MAG: TOBE domain-containing protein, partial [Polyangiaceae bacterium]|nr:TOBE domain-containing protein [Polyangiaceae bacterium]